MCKSDSSSNNHSLRDSGSIPRFPPFSQATNLDTVQNSLKLTFQGPS